LDWGYGKLRVACGQNRHQSEQAMPQSELILNSERLGFRLLEESDFENLKKLDLDPEVRAHFPEGVSTPEQIRERISKNRACFAENGFGDFAVTESETGRFVGRAGFGLIEGGEIEVGYVFLKEYWGQGLAQEALRALLAWAKQSLSAHRILAYTPMEHGASIHVMKKCRMRYLKTDIMRGVRCVFYEYPL
jgi:RimJ/RimL family protein N-acetyltransferase